MKNGNIKLTKSCTINGRRYSPGDIVHVATDTARKLFAQRAAVPAGAVKSTDGQVHLTRGASSIEGNFRAMRAFYLDGKLIPLGTILQMSDRFLIGDLMNARRIEPADGETKTRLRGEPTLKFEELPDHLRPQQQQIPGGVIGIAGRR